MFKEYINTVLAVKKTLEILTPQKERWKEKNGGAKERKEKREYKSIKSSLSGSGSAIENLYEIGGQGDSKRPGWKKNHRGELTMG